MAETKKTRVIVGMSGGVDSSAAAALLLEQGYDVVGITLKLRPQDCLSRAEDKCCGPQAVTDARSVCHRLGIPYYLIDEAEAFQKQVIAYFAEEYKAGRTPNPCVSAMKNSSSAPCSTARANWAGILSRRGISRGWRKAPTGGGRS